MELPLVVGVDGSVPSLGAVDWAVDEAARHGIPLRLVYASLWERYEGRHPRTASTGLQTRHSPTPLSVPPQSAPVDVTRV